MPRNTNCSQREELVLGPHMDLVRQLIQGEVQGSVSQPFSRRCTISTHSGISHVWFFLGLCFYINERTNWISCFWFTKSLKMCLIDSLMCLQVQGLETLATSQVTHFHTTVCSRWKRFMYKFTVLVKKPTKMTYYFHRDSNVNVGHFTIPWGHMSGTTEARCPWNVLADMLCTVLMLYSYIYMTTVYKKKYI